MDELPPVLSDEGDYDEDDESYCSEDSSPRDTLAARNMADAAAKQLSNAVYLRRHAWLRTTNIPDDARNRIEDSPFDGEGLFATTTDESLDTLVKMRRTAKSIANPSSQPQGQFRRQQQHSWQRQNPPPRRDSGRFRQGYQSYPYRQSNQRSQRRPQPPRRDDRKSKQNL
ncbi:hypothetical protein JRQ81_016005 [Phrynocephalus forsythii]|uniref:Uncharacterized protein n=1 Tax=Phrynocephalus forsythii TaxID=171643 RepID=A0A9Q0XVM5_9SAUR|nr:hypothetical protein JRQ81_016005 [Phrynocephalus forsythii]